MMYSNYIPGEAIWSFHIFMGIYLIYLAKQIQERKVPPSTTLVLYTLGILALMYHMHLWWSNYYKK